MGENQYDVLIVDGYGILRAFRRRIGSEIYPSGKVSIKTNDRQIVDQRAS